MASKYSTSESDDEEMGMGVDYACFGEFRCGLCNRGWESSKAWRDFGQQCEKCKISILPFDTQPLFYYCCETCNRVWKYKRVDDGCPCKECKEIKLPRKYRDFKAYWTPLQLSACGTDVIDKNKAHRSDLCEKCIQLGRPCYQQTHDAKFEPPTTVQINGQNAHVTFVEEPLLPFVEPPIHKPLKGKKTGKNSGGRKQKRGRGPTPQEQQEMEWKARRYDEISESEEYEENENATSYSEIGAMSKKEKKALRRQEKKTLKMQQEQEAQRKQKEKYEFELQCKQREELKRQEEREKAQRQKEREEVQRQKEREEAQRQKKREEAQRQRQEEEIRNQEEKFRSQQEQERKILLERQQREKETQHREQQERGLPFQNTGSSQQMVSPQQQGPDLRRAQSVPESQVRGDRDQNMTHDRDVINHRRDRPESCGKRNSDESAMWVLLAMGAVIALSLWLGR